MRGHCSAFLTCSFSSVGYISNIAGASACNYDDLSVSVFVNQHAAFMLDGATGGAQPAYTVASGAIVRQLNIWMDHFRKLPAAQRLTGQDAIDYLIRCMHLL